MAWVSTRRRQPWLTATQKLFEDPTAPGRYVGIGYSHRGRLLTVVHEVRGDRERVISAWKSSRAERKRYLTPEAEV